MKKILIVTSIILLSIGFNVLPAMAYSTVPGAGSAVWISASGTLTGDTVTFSASVVDQADPGTDRGGTLEFPAASTGKVNSGKCLKITGGTTEVGARIIIATDNNTLFTNAAQDPRQKPDTAHPGQYLYSGSDGSGMIGVSQQGYVAPLIWGVTDTPNVRPTTYAFGDSNWSYIVDMWHNHTYVPTLANGTVDPDYAVLDTANFYRVASDDPETNTADEGTGNYKKLYPQYFGKEGENWDLYDKPLHDVPGHVDTTRKVYTLTVGGEDKVVGQSLYQNIATVAYGIQVGNNDIMPGSSGYYICQVTKFGGTPPNNFSYAKLKQTNGDPGEFIYIPVGAIYTGLPSQSYGTDKLFVQMVKD